MRKPYRWKKHGLVLRPDASLPWMRTHCMLPTPFSLGNGLYRIYFSGRDEQNRSNIGFAVVDLNADCKVLEYSSNPVLVPGELGCFDDNGVTPSCVIPIGDKLHLYYIGWNPGSTVRFHLFGGLAISTDGGNTFARWSRAPIIERSRTDPFINTAPWVIHDNGSYCMYYVSGQEWVHKDLPRYNIKRGVSSDGLHWARDGHVCIDFCNDEENALARPYVVKEGGKWIMWFAHKGDGYRIGYAESEDGINWCRDDAVAGIDVTAGQFDSEMLEYAAVVEHDGRKFMFYNGNDYGKYGIGLATQE